MDERKTRPEAHFWYGVRVGLFIALVVVTFSWRIWFSDCAPVEDATNGLDGGDELSFRSVPPRWIEEYDGTSMRSKVVLGFLGEETADESGDPSPIACLEVGQVVTNPLYVERYTDELLVVETDCASFGQGQRVRGLPASSSSP